MPSGWRKSFLNGRKKKEYKISSGQSGRSFCDCVEFYIMDEPPVTIQQAREATVSAPV